jgi:hypothetical protein
VRPTLGEAVGVSVAATAVALVAGLVMLRPNVSRLTHEGSVGTREVVSISWPLLVTSIASFGVGTGVDLWVVGHFRPASDVALYGAAYRLVFFVATGFIIRATVTVCCVHGGMTSRMRFEHLHARRHPGDPRARGLPGGGPVRDAARVRPVLPPGRHGACDPERFAWSPSARLERRDAHDDWPPADYDGAYLLHGHLSVTAEILLAPTYGSRAWRLPPLLPRPCRTSCSRLRPRPGRT